MLSPRVRNEPKLSSPQPASVSVARQGERVPASKEALARPPAPSSLELGNCFENSAPSRNESRCKSVPTRKPKASAGALPKSAKNAARAANLRRLRSAGEARDGSSLGRPFLGGCSCAADSRSGSGGGSTVSVGTLSALGATGVTSSPRAALG